MQAPWLLVQSLWTLMSPSWLILLVFLFCIWPLLQSSVILFNRIQLGLMFVGLCTCFHQMKPLWVVKYQSIVEKLWASLQRWLFYPSSHVWIYPRSQGHQASGFWCPMQYQGWTHICNLGLRLDQPLVDHSQNLWVFLTPAYPISRTECRLRITWLGWISYHFTGSLSQWQEMIVTGDAYFRLHKQNLE